MVEHHTPIIKLTNITKLILGTLSSEKFSVECFFSFKQSKILDKIEVATLRVYMNECPLVVCITQLKAV